MSTWSNMHWGHLKKVLNQRNTSVCAALAIYFLTIKKFHQEYIKFLSKNVSFSYLCYIENHYYTRALDSKNCAEHFLEVFNLDNVRN